MKYKVVNIYSLYKEEKNNTQSAMKIKRNKEILK